MGSADWSIGVGGAAEVGHGAFQNSNVPTQQLTHDIWCRQIDNPGSTQYGRVVFRYNGPDAAEFTTARDSSVRGALALGIRGHNHSVGIGARIGGGVPTTPLNKPFFSLNGYQLLLEEDGSNWIVSLYRVTAGAGSALWANSPVAGASGEYRWFHLRLDCLLQPNGDVTLQVYQNDIVANPIVPPTSPSTWVKISPDISDLAVNVPAYGNVGFGGQVDPDPGGGGGTGLVDESYVDWIEVFHSV